MHCGGLTMDCGVIDKRGEGDWKRPCTCDVKAYRYVSIVGGILCTS